MAERNPNVECWTGPPIWVLSEEWGKVISAHIPYDRPGAQRRTVKIEMTDGKHVHTVIFGDRLVVLPEPYTCRDLAVVRRAR